MTTHIPKVARLSQNVIRILGLNPGPFTLQGTNTYLIGTGERRVLLDTGEPEVPEYVNLLSNVLQEQKCTISSIILSHWHRDHVGGLSAVLQTLNAQKEVNIFKIKNEIKDTPHAFKYTYIEDDHEIQLEDGLTLKLLETPGHTKDHLIVWIEKENVVFSGDCILGEGSTIFEDLLDYMASLNRIQQLQPLRIFPGHGPVIEKPAEKICEYIQHRIERENQLLQALPTEHSKAMTAEQLVQQLYPKLSKSLSLGAIGNILKNLTKLIKENRVRIEGQMPTNLYEIEKNEKPKFWKIN